MAKRDIEPEPLDDQPVATDDPTAGQRLRAAREEKGLSLEDVAAQTRIPRRHLESLENADWDSLPAPTYTTGFAKAYATVVGLDRTEIGDQLRAEMGGQRFASDTQQVFEAADPARTMPKWLVLAAIGAVIVLVAVMSWLNSRALEQPEPASNPPAAETQAPPPAAAETQAPQPAAAAPQAQGAVVLTATAPAWIQVTDQGKSLFQGELQPGQTYNVPPTAVAPELKAGKPEALRINVGAAVAPPVGPPGKVASHVSLKAADLMKGPAPVAAAPVPSTAAAAPTTNTGE